eukprot:scaffold23369_cov67-Phaeocystis_antarctica.AAC.7
MTAGQGRQCAEQPSDRAQPYGGHSGLLPADAPLYREKLRLRHLLLHFSKAGAATGRWRNRGADRARV